MLRIMTYNVHRCIGADGRADPRRVAAVIAECQPDIVALQELDIGRHRTGGIDQAYAIAQHLQMSFHFHPAILIEEERYGDAILTSLPMRLVQAERLPGSSLLEPRGAIWVAVNTDHAELQIINTHLSLVAHERLMQVEALLGTRWASCLDPLILLGDFNAVRPSRAYRQLSSKLRDAQLALPDRPRRTFPARMPMLRIDHIFCSASVEVLGIEVPRTRLARVASDHLPLVMDFCIAGGRTTTG